jgi:hypothetical protein
MYSHVTKAIKVATIYYQVHDIINEKTTYKKVFYEKRVTCCYFFFCINMGLLIFIIFKTIFIPFGAFCMQLMCT